MPTKKRRLFVSRYGYAAINGHRGGRDIYILAHYQLRGIDTRREVIHVVGAMPDWLQDLSNREPLRIIWHDPDFNGGHCEAACWADSHHWVSSKPRCQRCGIPKEPFLGVPCIPDVELV